MSSLNALVGLDVSDCGNTAIDEFFLVIMGTIVFLMQAGFAFLEAGSVNSKK